MSPLAHLARGLMGANRRRFALAALLSALVPLAGLVLMGLSGWFVAASAMAGLAGAGLVFDFFRPSALIRLTTFGRAASRYGERLTSHDATLRALVGLRLRIFADLARRPVADLLRLRSADGLNRLTADLDAVEGVLIRLAFPALAVLAAFLAGGVALWLLLGAAAAALALACHLAALAGLLALSGRALTATARHQEAALQSLRARSAETCRLRADAALQGGLPAAMAEVLAASEAAEAARANLDRAERQAQALLMLAPMVAVAGLLAWAPGADPARLLAALLLTLAMAEAPRLLWRGLAERGRMQLAAARMVPDAALAPQKPTTQTLAAPALAPRDPQAPLLEVQALTLPRPGAPQDAAAITAPLSFTLTAGNWLGLAAPSGRGKSTLLMALAGLLAPQSGQILLQGRAIADWPEADLRDLVTLVPQRPALIGGTVADNLALAAPQASAAQMRVALDHVALWPALADRGGLACALGAHGAGLSGGEARRLALARALLRRPALLLLDEPTEGLEAATARAMLDGLATALPDSAILIASHRAADLHRAAHGPMRQITLHPAATACP